MFSQQVGRSGRRIGQMAWRQQPSSLKAGQRRCYAEAAQGSQRRIGRGVGLALYGIAFGGIGAAATWYTMMRKGLSPYSDADTLSLFVPDNDDARRVEEAINNHPLVKELRSRPELTESRPHLKMAPAYRAKSLTAGTLQGPGKMVVPPFVWTEDGKSITSIAYVGEQLCGYPGIIHGGFLATILDEGLARSCFGAVPNNVAVTANLEINYRKPTPAGSFLVLRGRTVKVEGRKAWVEGHVETLVNPGEKPTILAEAKGLFISPKYAAVLPVLK